MCAGETARFARYILKIVQLIMAMFTIICLFMLGPDILWIAMLCSLTAPIFGLCCMWQCPDTKGKGRSAESRAWLKADYTLCFLFFFLYLIFAFVVLYHFMRFHHKSPRSDLLAVLVFISWASSLFYLLNALLSLHQFKVNNRTFHLEPGMVQRTSGMGSAPLSHRYSAGGVPKGIMRAIEGSQNQHKRGSRLDVYTDNHAMGGDLHNASTLSAAGHFYDSPPKECQEVAIELGEENGGKARHSAPVAFQEKSSRNRDSSSGSDLIIDHLALQAHRRGIGSGCSTSSDDSSRYASLDVEGIELDAGEVLREARVNLRKTPYAPPEMHDKSLDQSRESQGRRVPIVQSANDLPMPRLNNDLAHPSAHNSPLRPPEFRANFRSTSFTAEPKPNLPRKEGDEYFSEALSKSYHRFDSGDSFIVTEEQLDNFANRQSLAATDDSEISSAINQIIRAVEEPAKHSN